MIYLTDINMFLYFYFIIVWNSDARIFNIKKPGQLNFLQHECERNGRDSVDIGTVKYLGSTAWTQHGVNSKLI